MFSLNDVYQALVQKYPAAKIGYEPSQNLLTLPDFQTTAFNYPDLISLQICEGGQAFSYNLISHDAVFSLFDGLLSGSVTIRRADDCTICLYGALPDLRTVKPKEISVLHRAASAVIGSLLVLLAAFLFLCSFFNVDFSRPKWLEDLIPAVLGLTPLALGGGLIHHAASKKPLPLGWLLLSGVGICFIGFGMMLMFTTFTMKDDGARPDELFGVGVVAFLCSAIGMLTLWGSLRRKTDSQTFQPKNLFLRRNVERPQTDFSSQIIERMITNTVIPQFRVVFEPDRKPARTESKFGGKPYWDASLPYPMDSDGQPMELLAQIVLSDLPENDIFPRNGMLQFFLSSDSLSSRVIRHKTIDANQPEIPFQTDNSSLPFSGECAISFEKEDTSISPDDYRINSFMQEAAKELGIPLDPTLQFFELIEDDSDNALWDALRRKSTGTHLLGYPSFPQSDPRNPNEHHDILLLQIDSQTDPFPICWGDFGTAQFFLSEKRLKQLDFSAVSFTWDCY